MPRSKASLKALKHAPIGAEKGAPTGSLNRGTFLCPDRGTFDSQWDAAKRKRKKQPQRISSRYSVEAVQDAAAAWEEESGGARKSAATQWKLMTKMQPPPRRMGTRCSSRAAWKEENKGHQSDQIHYGGRRSSLQYSERLRKNRSIRGFRFLPHICICAKFFFHTTGFFLSSALPGICVYVQFYWVLAEWVPHHYGHSSWLRKWLHPLWWCALSCFW